MSAPEGTAMVMTREYAQQSAFSDPGPYTALLHALPEGMAELSGVVRNVIVHYRADGLTFTGDRLAEIDHRWLDRLLATDQRRFGTPACRATAEALPIRGAWFMRKYVVLELAHRRRDELLLCDEWGATGAVREVDLITRAPIPG